MDFPAFVGERVASLSCCAARVQGRTRVRSEVRVESAAMELRSGSVPGSRGSERNGMLSESSPRLLKALLAVVD